MNPPSLTTDLREQDRLAAVRRYEILDTPPDGAFERICALAARFFDVPWSSVAIVGADAVRLKASVGLDVIEIAREPGLRASAILQDEPYVVEDALRDPRTAGHPLVLGDPFVRFYAAAPIVTSDGHRLGTVDVLGPHPRAVSERDLDTLRDLAAVVMDELELRLAALRELRGEQQLRRRGLEQQRHAERLATTLQRSLSPPRLPVVPGMDVAVLYEPFAPEDVGGDFYDHFPLGPDRSSFFLGDVCGKGADAAAVTSLARYTMRTAALLHEGPWATLADLNAALLMEEGMQTCTAVYGEIVQADGAASARLSVAGHPAPLVVRAGGTVEPTTAHGTMLGAFADPSFHTCAVALAPGDAIVAYSDGILDCDVGGSRVDEEQVARWLAGPPDAGAQALVDRLGRALRGADMRDDVAVMALRFAP
jgi:sigma-B regulation protein RsbU (phosphoserine phosphatase)